MSPRQQPKLTKHESAPTDDQLQRLERLRKRAGKTGEKEPSNREMADIEISRLQLKEDFLRRDAERRRNGSEWGA